MRPGAVKAKEIAWLSGGGGAGGGGGIISHASLVKVCLRHASIKRRVPAS